MSLCLPTRFTIIMSYILPMQIEIGLTERAPDVTAILQAGAARLICVVIVAVVEWQKWRSLLPHTASNRNLRSII